MFRPDSCASEETCVSVDSESVQFSDACCQFLKPHCPSSSQEPARKASHLFLHSCDLCLCFPPQDSDHLRSLSDVVLCQVPVTDVFVPKQVAEYVVALPGVSRDHLFPEFSARDFPMHHQEWPLSLQVPRSTSSNFCLEFLEESEPCNGIREHFFDFLVIPSSTRGVRTVSHAIRCQIHRQRHVVTRSRSRNQL